MPSGARSGDVAETLRVLRRVFAGRSLRWYVFGAQAVNVWSRPRSTMDVDVTVFLGAVRANSLVRDLVKAGLVRRPGLTDEVVKVGRVMPFSYPPRSMPVDVVLGGPGLEEEFAARAVPVRVGRVDVPVITAEDLIPLKVLAGRRQDLDDVVAVVKARKGKLDLVRVRRTIRFLESGLAMSDLTPQLDALLAEANRPEPPKPRKPPRPAKRR